ncbi:MAG: hypothetical protein RI959_87 [Pseudomonadota bacterium]|jgi:N-glycosylase/DNA lyase
MSNTPAPGLQIGDLETVYDQLAQALDAVPADKTELFLVKLALLNAQALGDVAAFSQQLQAAQLDL